MRSKLLPISFVVLIGAMLAGGGWYAMKHGPNGNESSAPAPAVSQAASPLASASPDVSPSPGASASPTASPAPAASPSPVATGQQAAVDLTPDANGLSKTTAVITTPQGVIKFKFYPQDAPKTVARIVELIQKGFYNGLTFHRVVPGFVVQGGDPIGNGTGGSGQKLKAEFNSRKHVEGTVAMARAQDPDSADSQFYISLGTLPHLDHNYTVFGQVIDGMDVVRHIKVGDKITSMKLE